MSDTPERIWAWAWEVDRHRGQWSEVQEIVGEGAEYVRADLHAAAIALAERAEAEFAMARTDADQLRVDLRKAETALAMAEDALRVIALSVLSLSAGADAENRRHAGFVLAKIAALKGGAE